MNEKDKEELSRISRSSTLSPNEKITMVILKGFAETRGKAKELLGRSSKYSRSSRGSKKSKNLKI